MSTLTYREGLPNFFIVGAPKCGTTALFQYLEQHPDVFMSAAKEPHYFATDLKAPMYVQDTDRYVALFSDWAGEKAVGEASPLYLYSENMAAGIAAYKPDAKVIVMLRNPVDTAYSLHSGLVANGREDLKDFGAALAAETGRKDGSTPARQAVPPSVVHYREVVRYDVQLKRLYDHLAPENVMVIFYEDFRSDTLSVVRQVQEFLGVAVMDPADMAPKNTNKVSRLPGLWRRWMEMPPHQRARISALVPKPVRKLMLKANAKHIPRETLDPSVAQALRADMQASVSRLAEMTNRNLEHWK